MVSDEGGDTYVAEELLRWSGMGKRGMFYSSRLN